MKIVDKTAKLTFVTVRTEDIPVGTVFSGSIWAIRAKKYVTGTFYKAYGPNTIQGPYSFDGPGVPAVGIIVCLDRTSVLPGYSNLVLGSSSVKDYKPLDVELTVKGVL
jgi:hypothetical protein